MLNFQLRTSHVAGHSFCVLSLSQKVAIKIPQHLQLIKRQQCGVCCSRLCVWHQTHPRTLICSVSCAPTLKTFIKIAIVMVEKEMALFRAPLEIIAEILLV